MKNPIIPFLFILAAAWVAGSAGIKAQSATFAPVSLRCEGRENPLGVDSSQPRISWILQPSNPAARGLRQTAWQVLTATSPDLLIKNHGDLWDSGKVSSDAMNQIAYAGKPLVSSQPVFWKVRVWDQSDTPSAWS
ncbi:MAG: alpha-L-rhamnosidase, partial [Luteolibacter sp.]